MNITYATISLLLIYTKPLITITISPTPSYVFSTKKKFSIQYTVQYKKRTVEQWSLYRCVTGPLL